MSKNLTLLKWALVAFPCLLIFSSCKQYKKTKSGMAYYIKKGNSKVYPKIGNVVKYNVEYKLADRDTVLGNTYNGMPQFALLDSNLSKAKHSIMEIITQCAVGDKIEFTLSVDTLQKMGAIEQFDRLFKRGGLIKCRAEIIKIFATDKEGREDYSKEMQKEQLRQQKQMEKEMLAAQKRSDSMLKVQTKVLEEYLAKNKIKAIKTEKGVFVEIINQGTMPLADTGKTAYVKYTGSLTNGKQFESNASGPDLLPASLGVNGLAPGFEDGLKQFGVGGKGRLFIPSPLGYGEQGGGPIPPNSNLIFEIEVKEIVDNKVSREREAKKAQARQPQTQPSNR